jgi:hypothetical protein
MTPSLQEGGHVSGSVRSGNAREPEGPQDLTMRLRRASFEVKTGRSGSPVAGGLGKVDAHNRVNPAPHPRFAVAQVATADLLVAAN